MISDNEKWTNIWLGEGDVAIGVAQDEDGRPYGLSFQQLNNKYEIDGAIGVDDVKDGVKQINLLFTNSGAVRSLVKAIERFAESCVKQGREDEQDEPKTTPKA